MKGKRVIELGAGCGLAGFGKLNSTAHQMYYLDASPSGSLF